MQLDVEALVAELRRRETRRVAIDGPGGAGKSTLARLLAIGWPPALIVEMDDFETYQATAEPVGRPDVERLAAQVLEPHAAGAPGLYQRYDWDHRRLAEWHEVPPASVLVVEGVYSCCERLRPYFDYAIWVDAPHEVRLRRGVERDGETMRATWVERWMPAEQRYLESQRPDRRADLMLDGGSEDGSTFTVARSL